MGIVINVTSNANIILHKKKITEKYVEQNRSTKPFGTNCRREIDSLQDPNKSQSVPLLGLTK